MSANTELITTLLRKESRRKKRRAAIGRTITSLCTAIVHAFAAGWELMIAVGVIHAEWIPSLPTIGYWWAVLLVWLFTGMFSTPKTDRKDKADA